MNIVLPFCARDRALAVKLLERIAEMGGSNRNHPLLLAYEHGTPTEEVEAAARKAFETVALLPIHGVPKADWSAGTGDARACNEMWIQVAWHFHTVIKKSWLWMEPDSVVLTPDAFDSLSAGYNAAKKPFMGARVSPSAGRERLSGIAIYPASVCNYSPKALTANKHPWDLVGADDFMTHGAFTPLIHHVLRSSKDAPTFPDGNSLLAIQPSAVIFHPCKDGSLIDRLRERDMLSADPAPHIAGQPAPALQHIERLKLHLSTLHADSGAGRTIVMHAASAPVSIADQFRSLCQQAATIIDGKPGRLAQWQTALREFKHIRQPKKRNRA